MQSKNQKYKNMKYTEEQIKYITSWIEVNMKNYVEVTEEGDFGVDVERLSIDLKTHMRSDDYEPFDYDEVRLKNRRVKMKNGTPVRIVSFNVNGDMILGLFKNEFGSETSVYFDKNGKNLSYPISTETDPMANLVLAEKKKFVRYLSVSIVEGRDFKGNHTQTLEQTRCYDKKEYVVGNFVGKLEWEDYR